MPVCHSQHAIEPLTRLYLQSFLLLLPSSKRKPRHHWAVEITRLYLQSLRPDPSDVSCYALSEAPGSASHIQDDFYDIYPDIHGQDDSCNIASGSVIASSGGLCWYDTLSYPRHSCEPADSQVMHNNSVSLIWDYVVRSYHIFGK